MEWFIFQCWGSGRLLSDGRWYGCANTRQLFASDLLDRPLVGDEQMSPLVAIQYLRRRAAIVAGANSGATTLDATVLLLIADLIQQLESENAELRRAVKLSGQVMRNSIGRENE